MITLTRPQRSWMLAVSIAIGFASLGGKCGGDGGTPATPKGGGAGTGGGSCADICACLASACPDFPFAPDCVTACQDPTHDPWDISCRTNECEASKKDHDTHCPNASGQTMCR